MTKRIVSGIFILTALGALGVILAGALTSGEQLIVRFLTAVIVAALGLYVISDLRLQADDDAMTARTGGHPRIATVDAPPNSTAAFMATVTKRSEHKGEDVNVDSSPLADAAVTGRADQQMVGVGATTSSVTELASAFVEDAESIGDLTPQGQAIARPKAPETIRADGISPPPDISMTELFAPKVSVEHANSHQANGSHPNGSQPNGSHPNGSQPNGSHPNGSQANGMAGELPITPATSGGPVSMADGIPTNSSGADAGPIDDAQAIAPPEELILRSEELAPNPATGDPALEGQTPEDQTVEDQATNEQATNEQVIDAIGSAENDLTIGEPSTESTAPVLELAPQAAMAVGAGSGLNGLTKRRSGLNGTILGGAVDGSGHNGSAVNDSPANGSPANGSATNGRPSWQASPDHGATDIGSADGSGFGPAGADRAAVERPDSPTIHRNGQQNGNAAGTGNGQRVDRGIFDTGDEVPAAGDPSGNERDEQQPTATTDFQYSDELQSPDQAWPAPPPAKTADQLPQPHPFEKASAAYQAEKERLAAEAGTSQLPVPVKQGVEAADYADAPLAPIIDLREVNGQTSGTVDAAINVGEVEVIATLIEQGMLSTEGPISDRDVRTMVYVAFTSNELRKLLLAGGTPDGPNYGLDLGPVELFDERVHAPAPKTLYSGSPRRRAQSQIG